MSRILTIGTVIAAIVIAGACVKERVRARDPLARQDPAAGANGAAQLTAAGGDQTATPLESLCRQAYGGTVVSNMTLNALQPLQPVEWQPRNP